MWAFQGKVVEVCGVHDEVTARKGAGFESIDPNGKRGRAFWNDCSECYMVQTQDGYLLNVAEEFLRECEAPTAQSLSNNAEEIAWPKELAAREEFAAKVARTIRAKGYCLIQMPGFEELGLESSATLKARAGYTVPPQHFEEAYLGHNPCSKVLWLHEQGDPAEDALADADGQDTAGIDDLLADFGDLLRPVVGELLGFQLCTYRSGTMLRVPPADQAELQRLSPGPLADDDVESGYIRRHLDFIQRRRLCFMYFVDGDGSSVELWGRRDLGLQNATLTVGRGTVLVFRPDLMSYSYRASGSDDLVLQTWFLDEPQMIDVECLDVGEKGMVQVLGGRSPHPDRPDAVRLTGMGMRFPASGYDITKDWLVYAGQTDTFLDIPIIRWDMAAYYTEESGQFNTAGKSVQRHAGILKDMDEWKLFDEKFFNVPEDVALIMAPFHKIILNVAMDAFHTAGCKKESLRGAKISVNVAQDAGTWDPWEGYEECPDTWALATSQGGQNNSAARVSASFGLTGANIWVDTACSAALVAANLCVARLLKYEDETAGIVLGGNVLCDPWSFVGLSAAGMIGRAGRCMTFDIGANGFARGEGSGGLLLEHSSSPAVMTRRFVDWCGGYVNQDGRSASLTAPNGPSQQACIRASLRDARLDPDDVSLVENHGTGTALGDPIEQGSINAVFRKHQLALPVLGGKPNTGHTETCAGIQATLRVVCMLVQASFAPVVHLRILNGHIDMEGFPGLFPTEIGDLPTETTYGGYSGFGFGGTNARGDLWARRLHRVREKSKLIGDGRVYCDMLRQPAALPREEGLFDHLAKPCPQCSRPMCWLCGAALPRGAGRGVHHCMDIRDKYAPYDHCSDCYKGSYSYGGIFGDAIEESDTSAQKVYIVGSWSAWSTYHEMEQTEEGHYEGRITLGETLAEQFHLVLNRDHAKAIVPVVDAAGQKSRMIGPIRGGQGKHWLIDGRSDGVPAGTVYQVQFDWGEARKSLAWEALGRRPASEDDGDGARWAAQSTDLYSVVGSWDDWSSLGQMERDTDVLVFHFSVGPRCREEFQIVVNQDLQTRLYPPSAGTAPGMSAVLGPDAGADDLTWEVSGSPGQAMAVVLNLGTGDPRGVVTCEPVTW